MDFVKESVPGSSDRTFRHPNLSTDEEPMAGFTGTGTATDPYDAGNATEQPGNPLQGRHQDSAARLSQDAGNRVSVGGVAVPANLDKSHSTPLGASKVPQQQASLDRPSRFEEDLSPGQASSGVTGNGGLHAQQGIGGQRTSASGFDREPSGLHAQQGIGGQRTSASGFDREPSGLHAQQGIGGQRTSASGFDREPSGLQSQHGIGNQRTTASGLDRDPSLDTGSMPHKDVVDDSGMVDPSGLSGGSRSFTNEDAETDMHAPTSGGTTGAETQASRNTGPRRSTQEPPIPQEKDYKSSGFAAEGGDFDASASGAGKEAERLRGERGDTSAGRADSTRNQSIDEHHGGLFTGSHKSGITLEKAKEKLHIGKHH